jgi:hypothetical protein
MVSLYATRQSVNQFFTLLHEAYNKMMRNSTVLTNSHFSKLAIKRLFNANVDIETFRGTVLRSPKEKMSLLLYQELTPINKSRTLFILEISAILLEGV